MPPASTTLPYGSLTQSSTPADFHPTSTSIASDTVAAVVFGIIATLIGFITIWQTQKAWKTWHAHMLGQTRRSHTQHQERNADREPGASALGLSAEVHEMDGTSIAITGHEADGTASAVAAQELNGIANAVARQSGQANGDERDIISAVDSLGPANEHPGLEEPPAQSHGHPASSYDQPASSPAQPASSGSLRISSHG